MNRTARICSFFEFLRDTRGEEDANIEVRMLAPSQELSLSEDGKASRSVTWFMLCHVMGTGYKFENSHEIIVDLESRV